ncbi:MAG: hypothetical protein PHS44_04105 [Candidatus Dojkabacteria bacterium]|nr:hypothetical protein [Candidatus Dojkabacteria bacterium]
MEDELESYHYDHSATVQVLQIIGNMGTVEGFCDLLAAQRVTLHEGTFVDCVRLWTGLWTSRLRIFSNGNGGYMKANEFTLVVSFSSTKVSQLAIHGKGIAFSVNTAGSDMTGAPDQETQGTVVTQDLAREVLRLGGPKLRVGDILPADSIFLPREEPSEYLRREAGKHVWSRRLPTFRAEGVYPYDLVTGTQDEVRK